MTHRISRKFDVATKQVAFAYLSHFTSVLRDIFLPLTCYNCVSYLSIFTHVKVKVNE